MQTSWSILYNFSPSLSKILLHVLLTCCDCVCATRRATL